MYIDGKPFIAVEPKRPGFNIDSADVYQLGFEYSYKSGIPYFIFTNGAKWKVYDVFEKDPDKRLLLEVNILDESTGDIVRKLISLWRLLIGKGIKEPLSLAHSKETFRAHIYKGTTLYLELPSPKESMIINYENALRFYYSLNRNERVLLEIVYEAWKNNEKLTKETILNRLSKKGIVFNGKQFTGLKSGLTRKALRLGLSPPLPTEKELGEEYHDEVRRYRLKDERGIVLGRIIDGLKSG